MVPNAPEMVVGPIVPVTLVSQLTLPSLHGLVPEDSKLVRTAHQGGEEEKAAVGIDAEAVRSSGIA